MTTLDDLAGLEIVADGVEIHVAPADIVALACHGLDRRPAECSGTPDLPPRSFEGVLLADLLDAQIGFDALSPEAKRCGVAIAMGADGYRCVLSWGEIFNSEARSQCLIALSCRGQPLSTELGPLALVMAGDLNTGPRFVKHLRTIELRSL